MPNARDLRLQADYEQVTALADASGGRLVIESTKGRPPEQYVLTYRCRSIEGLREGKPVYTHVNRVRVKLPAKYPAPSAPPIFELLTPIFNPHVYPNRVVCMGSWQTTEYLEDVVLRIGALLQFDRRYLDVLDPANEQAMYWVTKNLLLLPTDNCTFRGEAAVASVQKSAPSDLPNIAELAQDARKEYGDTDMFTGLVEDTSLVWQDVE